MKSIEEIRDSLLTCSSDHANCERCAYRGLGVGCSNELKDDAANLLYCITSNKKLFALLKESIKV